MKKEEILKLADKYQEKADIAAENYQETGVTRYGSAARRNEDLAEALRMAAEAADEHQAYISMKGQMSNFAWRARMVAITEDKGERDKLMDSLVRDLVAYGKLFGLIRGE